MYLWEPVVWDVDDFLRDRGFIIASRPLHGQPTWTRAGREYSQSEALSKANSEKMQQLQRLEEHFADR